MMFTKLRDYSLRLWRNIIHLLTVKVSTKAGSCMIFLAIFATFVLGSGDDDVFVDSRAAHEYAFADKGDDVMIYTPALNRNKARDYYDGGKGVDVLWMRMTPTEFQQPQFQADLIRFHYFAMNNAHPNLASGYGPSFHFASLNLYVRNFEYIIVQNIADQTKEPEESTQTVIPSVEIYQHMQDTSLDSLV